MRTVKQACRESVLKRRSAMSPEERQDKSEKIVRTLIEHLETLWPVESSSGEGLGEGQRKGLFMFLPFGDEVDISPLAEWGWQSGIPIISPRTVPKTRRMDLRLITSWSDVQPGQWGIREPIPAATREAQLDEIGVILVPGTAFDRRGGRLGYGGGYYDRFFERMDEAAAVTGSRPLCAAPAFGMQILDDVPMEKHDIRVDALVTEEGWLWTPHKEK